MDHIETKQRLLQSTVQKKKKKMNARKVGRNNGMCRPVKQKGRYGMQGDGTELESEEQAAHLSGPPRLLSSNPDLKGLHLKACGEH